MFGLATIVLRSSAGPVPFTFVFWPAAGTVVGIYLFCHGFVLLQRKRLIMNTPSSKIRSAAMGLVEISGLATGPYTLTAPITGVPCYYYRTLVWQWKQSGKSSAWVKEADESLHVPFYLEDETGRVLVNPQGADLDIHRDFHDEFGASIFSSDLGVPATISNFLLAHGASSDKRTKIEEYCIKPKNALFILATLAENPGLQVTGTPVRSLQAHSVSFSTSMGPRLSINTKFSFAVSRSGADSPQPVAINQQHAMDPVQQAKVAAALTKAGITSPAAWAAAGISPAQPAKPAVSVTGHGAAAVPALEQFDLHPATVLMQGSHDRSFFISWRSQRDVVNSLGWKSTLMIWGGPALTLVSVSMLAAMLGWL